ncbi:MAG: SusD/RagB family nutrient-binding outer membrane lipoprotein, partial [Bacteroidales bacterium]|nr:SusD/RagB family nutrient-binding outer membrane lipoprotein [Bacteroidales bacterium]
IKNLVDGIANSADKPNVNAVLRIHWVYMMSVLTDVYGDIPCMEAGKGYTHGIANPSYDQQKDIYDFFFKELDACQAQIDPSKDHVTGDVTSFAGDVEKWRRYANSLRMRLAMRISDVDPERAKAEFEAAYNTGKFIASAENDAFVKFIDAPFTLYEGARDLDFRVNALSEVFYGQDKESPTLVCATLYNKLSKMSDPRLYRICRHYNYALRDDNSYDVTSILDCTEEVAAWEINSGLGPHPLRVGQVWYSAWVDCPSLDQLPNFQKKAEANPEYTANNHHNRMIRPFLALDLMKPTAPGILMTWAEQEFLLAEAASKGWTVTGGAEAHYNEGVSASMKMLNNYYLSEGNKISDAEIEAYLLVNPLGTNPKESINTQAWILHLTNPVEAWSNLLRSDYPVLDDRTKVDQAGFPDGDEDMTTPVRLKYPNLEGQYNAANYKAAIARAPLNGEDNWHIRVWWDVNDGRYE